MYQKCDMLIRAQGNDLLLYIYFRPSTTSEPFRTVFDQEYRAAEFAGQQDPNSCNNLFPECSESFLEYFTEILE